MRYPNAQEQQFVDKIERREKQIRMLQAGAVEGVILQLREEIADLRAYLQDMDTRGISPCPDERRIS